MKLSLLLKRYNIAIIPFISLSSLLGKPLFANNFTKISVSINNNNGSQGVLTCAYPSTTLTATTTASGTTTYSWTGPNSFTATGSSVTISTAGTYTVTGTNSGKTGSASVTVTSNTALPPALVPGNTGPLTCSNTSALLVMPFGDGTGLTVAWAGPNGFTSTDAFPTVTVPGTYYLVSTYTATGCSTSSPTTVVQDMTAPASVAASNGGPLTCSTSSVTLIGTSSTTSGVTYAWTGPNGFTASSASATATAPGTYNLTATYTSTGCTATTPTTVLQNITAPAIPLVTSNPVNALLTCTTTGIALNANSSNPKVGYAWTGPSGFTFNGMTTSVTVPGTYTVIARDSTNGCTSTSSAAVTQDTARPSSVITNSVPANAQLTCSVNSVSLTGSSNTTGVNYSWSGPSGFTANSASISVTTAGNYTVTVTNPNNGCATSVTAPTVTQNTTVPGAVTATVSDRLTCSRTSVKLTGSSTTSGVTFAWSGPNGFTSTLTETFVSAGGLYTLTATDPSNGCSFSRQITVQADQVHPEGVTVSSDGSLSCSIGSVTLTGNSSTTGVNYTWTGPNGFFDPQQITSAVDSGTYVLTVNNPGNGCNTTASIVVTANFTGCSAVVPKVTNGYAATLDASAEASAFTYKVYPNPVNSAAFIELSAPTKEHLSVEIYNSIGVRENILFDGVVEAGTPYRWTLNANRLATGIHYCLIRTNNKTYVSKLLR